jgi:hypothetical protein
VAKKNCLMRNTTIQKCSSRAQPNVTAAAEEEEEMSAFS